MKQIKPKIIVLKSQLTNDAVEKLIEEKKTALFRSLLNRPKKEDIHVYSIKLFYEAFVIVNASYNANYYRKAHHKIKVDYNVKEVILGDGVFPISKKSEFDKFFDTRRSKNNVDLELEEHVFVKEKGEMYLDHHGKEVKFPFKINSKTIENYPNRILDKNNANVKRPEITVEAITNKMQLKLKKTFEADVRDIKDEFVVREMSEVYIPIYESRLVGPKKKVKIMRIDAIRKKIL